MISKPPGLPFVVVFSAAAAVVLTWASYPYWYGIEMFLFTIPVGALLLAYWAIRMVWAERKGTLESSSSGRWIIPWFIAGGVMLALMTDAPFWIRFTLSAPSMEAYAKSVAENPDRKEPCQWVGLYYVCGGQQHLNSDTGEKVPGSAEFSAQDWFLDGNKGFLWLPFGEPVETADASYRYLKDRWYGYQGWDNW
ncbi:hypothetical protein [Streptosporangium sp. OZ121]|uniref:hypothetical protein n=1 Tax=Streptosporangium sp. OZ121 TaxID=3444183 RepID=UPI003F7914EE